MECNEEQLHPAVSSTIWNIRPPSPENDLNK